MLSMSGSSCWTVALLTLQMAYDLTDQMSHGCQKHSVWTIPTSPSTWYNTCNIWVNPV